MLKAQKKNRFSEVCGFIMNRCFAEKRENHSQKRCFLRSLHLLYITEGVKLSFVFCEAVSLNLSLSMRTALFGLGKDFSMLL